MNKLINLIECMVEAKENNAKYVGIKVKTKNFPKEELIINLNESIDSKLNYYMNAYNDDLKLKSAPDIVQITGFEYADNLMDLEKKLLNKENIVQTLKIKAQIDINEEQINEIAKEALEKLIDCLKINTNIYK